MADTLYTYSRIDLSTNAIRVLRLCRGYETDPITCELVQVLLEDDGIPYEALSYTWGDASVEVAVILDGRKKMIQDNLYTALCCLRRADEDRWLWVDALCIDQVDDKEKTHQVGRMRQIYEKADRVLIWLGTATDEISLLMEIAASFGKSVRRGSTCRVDKLAAWQELWAAFVQQLGGIHTELNVKRRNGLAELLQRPWFRRVWVVQEAFSAKRAAVLCGWNQAPSEVFVMLPTLMDVSVSDHVQPVLDVMPGYFRQSSWRSEETDLRTLLGKFRYSHATDPRDNIYALLGIASDIGSRGGRQLEPDYALPEDMAVQSAVSYLVFGLNTEPPLCSLPLWNFQYLARSLDDLTQRLLDWAVSNSKEDTVKQILELPGIVTEFPRWEARALVFVAAQGISQTSARILEMLLRMFPIDVNERDARGDTLLHLVSADAVAVLLAQDNIELNPYNNLKLTPLGLALERGNTKKVCKLIETEGVNLGLVSQIYQVMGFPPSVAKGGPPQNRAARPLLLPTQDQFAISTMLSLVQKITDATLAWLGGKTPLYVAAEHGDVEAATLLLKHGAGPEFMDKHNTTPLWAAASEGKEGIVELLLNRELHTDDGSRQRWAGVALWAAAETGRIEVVQLILRLCTGRGPELLEAKELSFGEETTPLQVASRFGHRAVIDALAGAGADIQARDGRGCTVLWNAIAEGRLEHARFLLTRGARLEHGDAVVYRSRELYGALLLEPRFGRCLSPDSLGWFSLENIFLDAGPRELEEQVARLENYKSIRSVYTAYIFRSR
ncbi:hypothetical protein OQA88_2558 [Cercophora sp. LCS_1]